MAIARAQDVCATAIDLKMEDATLDDVVARLKPTLLNKNISIEVRGAEPIHVSFDLKKSSVGKVLTPVAALAGCKFYVFSRGLLIAPPSQLTEAEKLEFQQGKGGEWSSNTSVNEHRGWDLTLGTPPSLDKQRATDACATVVNLKLENATLDNVLEQIKRNLTDQTVPIEIRGASSIRASFDLQNINIGNALTPIAALAGCNLYVLTSGVLLTSPDQLTKSEKLELQKNQGGVWEDNADAGDFITSSPVVNGMRQSGWSVQKEARILFGGIVAQEAMGDNMKPTGSVKTSFGNFSPDSQAMLQQMANWVIGTSRTANSQIPFLHLTPNSPVSVAISPEAIQIDMKGVDSDKGATSIGMTTFLHP